MIDGLDTRLVTLLLWGGGTVAVYAIVFLQRFRAWRLHHDDRARRDVVSGFALFMTALGSALAVTLVLFGEAGGGLRGLTTAVALGAFTGAGLIMASEGGHEDQA